MKWYNKYIQVYEKPVSEIPAPIIEEVCRKLAEFQSNEPLASIVLIAHNEATHLLSCLWSLCDNQFNFPIEIITVNNNSTDNTEEVLQQLGARYYNESQKGPGYARQCGLNHARGKLHLCIDADTLYPPYYIKTHVEQLMKPGIIATFSLWSFMADNKHSQIGLWFYENLRDVHLHIQAIKRPELCVRGMAFGFHTEPARLFGFRTDIIRGEDGSLALAMKSQGKLVFIRNHKARVLTSNGTINADGSLMNSFKIRMIKALKGITGLFTPKDNYKDEDSNLIK
ncbi:glycosyltransferase family 2 protein [Bacteroides sp. K03]|uniref:glycosyltransferase family 2 protein n=1 Tax=Bacteroides TaxID=816 RepID=UPI001C8C4382|nr:MULTISPECIES: glycosyltransferase family A protein [Bacteroides]MBX9188544.1 glycosyltransferase family 2 protein [Bacteroides sp. K03]